MRGSVEDVVCDVIVNDRLELLRYWSIQFSAQPWSYRTRRIASEPGMPPANKGLHVLENFYKSL